MAAQTGIKITWLGHATTKIETASGKIILIDPWLEGNPAVPADLKQIDHVDLMLITHVHQDHMGDAIPVAQRTQPDVIAIYEFCDFLTGNGVKNCTGINKGGTVEWNGIRVTMVDAIHSSGFMQDGQYVPGGTAAGFVIRFEDGFVLYFAGDTDVFESMRLIGTLYKPDLAMLPIGDHFTMGPKGAATAIDLLGVKRVIPIHWGTFPLLTGTPEALQQETSKLADFKVISMKPGETVTGADIA